MIAAYRKQADYLALVGVLVQFLGGISTAALTPRGLGWVALGIVIAGWLLLVGACATYSRARGYSAWWGALGVLNLLGPIVLTFFPDRCSSKRRGFDVVGDQAGER